MRRLVLSCLAALFAVLGLSAASSGGSAEAQALGPVVVAAVQAVPGSTDDDREVASGADDVLGPFELAAHFTGDEEREPAFLTMVALAAMAAGLGASVRLHTAARRRTG